MMSPWRKWFEDLSSTKTQAGYAGMLLGIAIITRGLWLAKTAQDVATLASASWPIVATLLTAWGIVKVYQMRNGSPTPSKPS